MTISSKKIAEALVYSIQEGLDVLKLSQGFEKFMKVNHLEALTSNVLKNLEKMIIGIKKKKTATIKVSHDVTDKTIESIKKFIEKDASDPIRVEIDEKLIGGFQAKYKGMFYDGSIKNYLKELRGNLMN